MNFIYYLHFLIPISVILLPTLPVKYLKHIFWYPIIYFLIWIIFDGCPITQITPVNDVKTDKDNFLLPIFRKYIDEDSTSDQSNYIVSFFIALSIVISAYKIIFFLSLDIYKNK